MFENIPVEISFGGIYMPPLLLVVLFGVLSAYGITVILNRTDLSRYFWFPPLAFVALTLLMTSLIGLTFFSP
jgi:hypothetical protein